MQNTQTLYRPINKAELDLIAASGFLKFPPRLPEQPFFYPVMNEEYARQITVEWNVPAYGAGYVVKFEVEVEYLKISCPKCGWRYSQRTLGTFRRIGGV